MWYNRYVKILLVAGWHDDKKYNYYLLLQKEILSYKHIFTGMMSDIILWEQALFCVATHESVMPDLIMLGRASLSEARPYSVRAGHILWGQTFPLRPDLILWGQNSFCKVRPHSVRPNLAMWEQTSFCEARPYFVVPDRILWIFDQTSFCEVNPYSVRIGLTVRGQRQSARLASPPFPYGWPHNDNQLL